MSPSRSIPSKTCRLPVLCEPTCFRSADGDFFGAACGAAAGLQRNRCSFGGHRRQSIHPHPRAFRRTSRRSDSPNLIHNPLVSFRGVAATNTCLKRKRVGRNSCRPLRRASLAQGRLSGTGSTLSLSPALKRWALLSGASSGALWWQVIRPPPGKRGLRGQSRITFHRQRSHRSCNFCVPGSGAG